MKNFLYLITIFLLVTSCTNNTNMMQLSGEVKGLKKGTLILQTIDDTLLVSVDSVVVDGDSRFNFSKTIESPQMYYLYVRLKDGTLKDDRIPFFAEPTEITINTSLKNFEIDAQISGSHNEKVRDEYKKLLKRYTSKNLEYIEASFKALQEGNDSLVLAIQEKQKKLVASKYLMAVNFALKYKDLELAPFLMLSEVFDANIKYLDTVYNTLTPKIKDSKYGKSLESFIIDRKNEETSLKN